MSVIDPHRQYQHEHGDNEHEHGRLAHTHLTSVGIDIGSSTSHCMFSRLTVGYPVFQRRRPEVLDREVIGRSPVMLTPFSADWNINPEPLRTLIFGAFNAVGLSPEAIDTGAVIVTGEAARRDNAQRIAELFSDGSGRFVCATAGPHLEGVLAAHGSGAVARSREQGLTLLHVDLGGGTTKAAIISNGIIAATTSMNVGARLIACDESGRIVRLETGGRRFLRQMGRGLAVGDVLPSEVADEMAARMAAALFSALDGSTQPDEEFFITPPMPTLPPIDGIVFSGGVSEYVYGHETSAFGDLGPLLGPYVRQQADARGYVVMDAVEGIRATVIGASEYSVQLSGETIFIPESANLPFHNLRIFVARVTWDAPIAEHTERAVQEALDSRDPEVRDSAFALAITSPPFRGYGSAQEMAEGIRLALAPIPVDERPSMLVFDQNVGQVVGEVLAVQLGIPCIDEVSLSELDFIDVGTHVAGESYVPVVIKSLAFGA